MILIGAAVLTVVLSWAVINTVYTLRYADQHFRSKPGGIAFGAEDGEQHPGYRDFACSVNSAIPQDAALSADGSQAASAMAR